MLVYTNKLNQKISRN